MFYRILPLICFVSFGFILQACDEIVIPSSKPIKNTNQTTEVEKEIGSKTPSERGFTIVPTTTPPPVPYQGTRTSQHALVVGIDKYKYSDGNGFTNLDGAVNDAKLLSEVLRNQNVELPDSRILLNENATRANFIRAWNSMVAKAKPGDTLILTFSGHGGQETDLPPLDEKDGQDETLMFHDFNPQTIKDGRISDDELLGIFKKAKDYKILFLADSCHSSGMVRSLAKPAGKFRSAGSWNIQPNIPPPTITVPTEGDENHKLPKNITLITAVDSDSLQVPETTFYNQAHGAVSWFFAKAINGDADGNKNGRLERNEIETFLKQKVTAYMDRRQTPKLIPRGDNKAVFSLNKGFEIRPTTPNTVKIAVQNGSAPSGLQNASVIKNETLADLLFVIRNSQTEVFNKNGDKVTTLTSNTTASWQALIDKKRLLNALEKQFKMSLKPIKISLKEGDKLHKQGEVLHFSIVPGDKREGLNALTLFNLAGNGELQFLYPLSDYGDKTVIKKFPYKLPAMKVSKPFGGDNLVAILCKQPVTSLHSLLVTSQPNIPKPSAITTYLDNCQVGQYAFFSSN
jgi:hypothetical protein